MTTDSIANHRPGLKGLNAAPQAAELFGAQDPTPWLFHASNAFKRDPSLSYSKISKSCLLILISNHVRPCRKPLRGFRVWHVWHVFGSICKQCYPLLKASLTFGVKQVTDRFLIFLSNPQPWYYDRRKKELNIGQPTLAICRGCLYPSLVQRISRMNGLNLP